VTFQRLATGEGALVSRRWREIWLALFWTEWWRAEIEDETTTRITGKVYWWKWNTQQLARAFGFRE
jgi:hypothetical protein